MPCQYLPLLVNLTNNLQQSYYGNVKMETREAMEAQEECMRETPKELHDM